MIAKVIRVLRTPHSERYLLQDKSGKDFAALDLHYMLDGKVDGTLILFGDEEVSEIMISAILKQIDEDLLPEVKIEDGNLSFTVVKGSIVGSFTPHLDK